MAPGGLGEGSLRPENTAPARTDPAPGSPPGAPGTPPAPAAAARRGRADERTDPGQRDAERTARHAAGAGRAQAPPTRHAPEVTGRRSSPSGGAVRAAVGL